MNSLIKSLLTVLALMHCGLILSQNITFREESNWEKILAISKVENKFIFVDAQTTWCRPCKEMEKTVFTDSSVASFYNKNFISVKFDMEKGDGKMLTKKYNVYYFPTYLFIDSAGNLMHRNHSMMPVEAFLGLGKNALNIDSQYFSQKLRYKKGERSLVFLKQLSFMSKNAFDEEFTTEISCAYLKLKPNWFDNETLEFIKEFTKTVDNPNIEFIFNNRDIFKTKFGNRYVTFLEENTLVNDVIQHSYINENDESINIQKAKKYVNTYINNSFADKLLSKVQLRKYQFDKDSNLLSFALSHFDKYPSENVQNLGYASWLVIENTDDISILKKATTWALKAAAIESNFETNDTLANLYYKIGDMISAEMYAKKAIGFAKKDEQNCEDTEKLLQKIKSKK